MVAKIALTIVASGITFHFYDVEHELLFRPGIVNDICNFAHKEPAEYEKITLSGSSRIEGTVSAVEVDAGGRVKRVFSAVSSYLECGTYRAELSERGIVVRKSKELLNL